MEKIRFNEIDIVKGICMLLVFFNHSVLYFPINYRTPDFPICSSLISIVSAWYMPCFFMISGFLFANSQKTYAQVLGDKIKRLAVPYLVVCAISCVIKLLKPDLAAFGHSGLTENLYYYFVKGGDRWFLYVLFFIFVIIHPLKKILHNNTFYILLSLLAVYALVDFEWMKNFYPLDRILSWSRFFVAGFLLRKYYTSIRFYFVQKWYIFVLLFIVFNVFFVLYKNEGYWQLLFPFTGSFFCISVSLLMTQSVSFSKTRVYEYIQYVGKFSLQFYVMTGFVLMPARYIMVNLLHQSSPLIVVSCVFAIQLVLATIGVYVCGKIKPCRILFGY